MQQTWKNNKKNFADSLADNYMGVGGRPIWEGCKRSVNFLPEFPIVLSENLTEWKEFLLSLGGAAAPLPRLLRLWIFTYK